MAARKSQSHELDADDRNAMPDSTFAYPRLRKEPLNDASHVRNAIARFDQVRDATDAERDEAFRRIKRAAKRFDVDVSERSRRELGKPSATRKSSDKPRTPKKTVRSNTRSTERSRDELYAEAKRRDVKGRSRMTKAELLGALEGN
jgi:hypothetical protein